MIYDASWKKDLFKKKYRIFEYVRSGQVEFIGSYPDFKSVGEGLHYIRTVLDTSLTGRYGISSRKI